MKPLALLLTLALYSATALAAAPPHNPARVLAAQPHDAGLMFKENKHQWDSRILYKLESNGAVMLLEPTSVYYALLNPDDLAHVHPAVGPVHIHGHAYRVDFVGAQAPSDIETENKSDVFYNYFIGNDPTRWASDVHGYKTVRYKNIYPDIDAKFYIKDGLVKYDFIAQPGADVSQIKLKYTGADALRLKNGNLYIETSVGHVVEMSPVCYQNGAYVKCRYELHGNEITFDFPKDYNHAQPLTVDPTLIFATYTGSTADNFGYTCTYDAQGNMYLGGYVNAIDFSTGLPTGNYPATAGAFDVTWNGGTGGQSGSGSGIGYSCDMGIMKLNPTGTTLIYATYLGGSDNETPHSLFVNSLGQLVVYGRTYSTDFPVLNAYQSNNAGGADISITVLNASGTALIGSTYIGGAADDGVNYSASEFVGSNLKTNYGDDARGEVVCDASNNIYLVSCTKSSVFPTTTGAYQTTFGGLQDGCAFKLSPNTSTLMYSTYLGGSQDDACYSTAVKSDGSTVICGGTMSNNFPSAGNGVNNSYLGGTMDGFVLHLSANGTQLLNSTFLGTNSEDQAYIVKMDLSENVYVVGQTKGNYPVINVNYSIPNSGLFITKLNPALNTIVYSTVFGQGGNEPCLSPTAFLVDTCENVYVCGWGGQLVTFGGFPFHLNPMSSLPVTNDAIQSTTDGKDFYLAVFKKNMDTLLFATFYGGTSSVGEHVDGGTSRFDPNGIVYEAICASCGAAEPATGGTPTTAGVWSPTNQSGNCNELGMKMDINLFKLHAAALANPAATGCAPLHVNFINNSTNASAYHWYFGTGNAADTSSQFQPNFTFNDTGTYQVMLVAYSNTACVPTDTAYTSVVVFNTNVSASFNYSVADSCDSLIVTFHGVSSSAATQFSWQFGDTSSASTTSTLQNPVHVYHNAGYFHVFLTITDTTACNPIDTFSQVIAFTTKVQAKVPDDSIKGCSPLTAHFKSVGFGGVSYLWLFGDGGTSTDSTPSHTYTNAGDYTATLVVTDPAACNHSDTAHVYIKVYPPPPTADFTFIAQGNTATFTNQSVGAVAYGWDFGDGATSTETNPTHTFAHLGSYSVCLRAYNNGPCYGEACRSVNIAFEPNVDVPNAFSPNGDGANDVLLVKGRGVKTLLFRVFNRWGEKVFESTDMAFGWDGFYKHVPQEMDVYAWTLNAVLDDDRVVIKAGNVTLLR